MMILLPILNCINLLLSALFLTMANINYMKTHKNINLSDKYDIFSQRLRKNISATIQSKYFIWFVFFVLALNVILFTYFNSIPYVKSDGWRFIDIYLIPWSEGTLVISDLFREQPITAGLFIINAELFGLRMDYEGMFGVIFVIMSGFLLIRKMEKHNIDRLSIITAAAILLSLVSVNVYAWSLVTIGHIGGLFSFLVIFYIDRITQRNFTLREYFILSLYLILYLLIFSDFAKLVFASIFGVYSLGAIFEKKIEYLKLLIILVIAFLLSSVALGALGVHGPSIGSFGNVFTYFDGFVKYIGIALMSAWVNIADFKTYFGLTNYAIEIIGLIVLAVYLATCFLYYKIGMYKKTKAPIIFIAIGFLTAFSAWLFRYQPDIQEPIAANMPRYYRIYSLAVIGFIWICAEYMRDRTTSIRIIGACMVVILLGSHTISVVNGWNTSKYIRKGTVKINEILISHGNGDFSENIPRFVTGNNYPEPYTRGIKYLKDNKMNVFMENSIARKYK